MASQGSTALLLVSGYSGIGKSSLVGVARDLVEAQARVIEHDLVAAREKVDAQGHDHAHARLGGRRQRPQLTQERFAPTRTCMASPNLVY